MTYRCTVIDPAGPGRGDLSFDVDTDRPVLHEMQMRGVPAIPIGCRGGGCGVCRVEVMSGNYRTKRMSSRHISDDDLANGVVLACRIFPESDLTVRPAVAPGTRTDLVVT